MTLDVELDLAKLAFPRKNDDRLTSLSVGFKTASKEDIAQHELRKYKGSRMASFRAHNHLASMKNSTMAYRTWKGSRAALTKKERLTEKYIRTLNLQWRVKRVEEFLSAASLDGLAPVKTYSAHMRTAEYCATRKEARWRFSDIKMVLRV